MEYGDAFTREKLDKVTEVTPCFVLPEGYNHMGSVVKSITSIGLFIGKIELIKFRDENELIEVLDSTALVSKINRLLSDVTLYMEVIGEPAKLQVVFDKFPFFKFYRNNLKIVNFFKTRSEPSPAVFDNCSCLIIKPHASEHIGEIIKVLIENKFEISAIENFNNFNFFEFSEIYREILNDQFNDSVHEMSTGNSVVIQVRKENCVEALRQLCGPYDPEIARHLSPETLRAKYGVDRVKNAVHCSDLEEDGKTDCQYFFKIVKLMNNCK